MSTQPLEQAIAVAKGVLANVNDDQMSAATPCASWDVAALINHMVGGQGFFAAAVNGQPPTAAEGDVTEGDYRAAFDAAGAECIAAFSADGAMDSIVKAPFGDMPAQAFMGLALTDTFQHAWDLAKATGQSTDLAPEMAEMLLSASRASISDNFRGDEGAPFGAEQPCDDHATAADRLAAFLGRSV